MFANGNGQINIRICANGISDILHGNNEKRQKMIIKFWKLRKRNRCGNQNRFRTHLSTSSSQ